MAFNITLEVAYYNQGFINNKQRFNEYLVKKILIIIYGIR
jgi:hypothetical protein